jgi:N-hydroxyarylamine O-acetyltransferase
VVDLRAYTKRIGVAADVEKPVADLNFLRQIILAHTQTIPFENLNVLMRRTVPLDLESLESKLLHCARGGYCFEQNALFAEVLAQIGYRVERLAGRVVWGASAAPPWQNPRTHMLLLVHVGGERFLCDVGFGGVTPTAPLPFTLNERLETPNETYRIVEQGEVCLLQAEIAGQWLDVYLFDLQPQSAIDYEMANHYVATHPASQFRYTLMAARAFEGGRYHLRNRTVTIFTRGEKEQRELEGPDAQLDALRDYFGIEVPDVSEFVASLEHVRED